MARLSVLDLSPICEGQTAADAFRNTRDLAQHVENWGYYRFWLAEHHNLPGIGSAATVVLICYVAGATKIIRVGAGGIMFFEPGPSGPISSPGSSMSTFRFLRCASAFLNIVMLGK